MRPSQFVVLRPGEFLLVLVPVLLFGSLNWLLDPAFAGAEAIVYLAMSGPMCLLAIWCALGRTNVWLRWASVAAICAAWARWISLFQPGSDAISAPYFIGIFATLTWPLCLLRCAGVSIRLSRQTAPVADATTELRGWNRLPRFSLANLLQLVTLGALLMACDRIWEFSHELDLTEIIIGAGLSVISAVVAWVCLGTRKLWLRIIAWLSIPAIVYWPLDGDWQFLLTAWLGLSALMSLILLGFRQLGYRMEWGPEPAMNEVANSLPWRLLLRDAASVMVIGLYLYLLSRGIARSQVLTGRWYADGMATLGAYLNVSLLVPPNLLAIWGNLGRASWISRLLGMAAGCAAGMYYLEVAKPFDPLQIDPRTILQQLLATAAPLFALRLCGFTICRPAQGADNSGAPAERMQFTLGRMFVLITAVALLMALYYYSAIFPPLGNLGTIQGILLTDLLIVSLVYACLGTARWWQRLAAWLFCYLLAIGLPGEFPLRIAASLAATSFAMGSVLLAFRFRGYRWVRRRSNLQSAPVLAAFDPLPTPSNSLALAANK